MKRILLFIPINLTLMVSLLIGLLMGLLIGLPGLMPLEKAHSLNIRELDVEREVNPPPYVPTFTQAESVYYFFKNLNIPRYASARDYLTVRAMNDPKINIEAYKWIKAVDGPYMSQVAFVRADDTQSGVLLAFGNKKNGSTRYTFRAFDITFSSEFKDKIDNIRMVDLNTN